MHVFNDKVISLILGAPGSGKTTMIAKIVKEANKKRIPVYCNWPVLGAIQVDMKSVIKQDLGESVLIIDEAGLHYNSRQSKNNSKDFGSEHYHWFATTRHRKTQIFVVVQSWKRIDIVLRELGTEVIMCKRGFFSFTTYRRYVSDLKLVEDRDGNAMEFQEVFSRISWRAFWRPNYYHMFDSYALDKQYDLPMGLPYDPAQFPSKLPLWRRLLLGLLGIKPKARQRAAGRKRAAALIDFFKSRRLGRFPPT